MKMDKKIAFAVLFAIMFLVTPVTSMTSVSKAVVRMDDPTDWYMYVPGVLDTDTYTLYPYTDTSLNIGFSKFGEFINPFARPSGDKEVGLEYGPRDAFARTGVAMNAWLNGWLINVTYVSSLLSPSFRNVWAFAEFADTTEPGVGGDWVCGLPHYMAGAGGRQTNGYAETDPIHVIQDGPRRFVAILTTHLYDVMGSFRFPLVDVVFTIVFDKAEKNVIVYKDIHYRLGPKEGMINVQFSNRGQWDLGPAPTFYSEAKYFHQDMPTCYGADYLLTPWILRDVYDIIAIPQGESLFSWWYTTKGGTIPQSFYGVQGHGHLDSDLVYTLGCPHSATGVGLPLPAVLGTEIVKVDDVLQSPGSAGDYVDIIPLVNQIEDDMQSQDMRAIKFNRDIVGPAVIRIEYKNVMKYLKIWNPALNIWEEQPESHHYDVAQFISADVPTPLYVGYAAFWPTCSDYTVDGWQKKFVNLWGTPVVFSTDVTTSVPKKIPFLIGEWDFILDPATSQFRGVTKYGIVDYNDADNSYNAPEAIESEAMYALDEVFNPFDLNDATNKITSRNYEKFTATTTQTTFPLDRAVSMYDFAYVGTGATATWSTTVAHSGLESARLFAPKDYRVKLDIPWKVQLEKLKATLDDETKVYWYVYLSKVIDNLQGYDLTMQMNIYMDNDGDGIADYAFWSVGTDQTGVATCVQNWPALQWIKASPRETNGGTGPGIQWQLSTDMYGIDADDAEHKDGKSMGYWNSVTHATGAFKEDTVIAIDLNFMPVIGTGGPNYYDGYLYIDDVTFKVYEPLTDDYRTVTFDLENLNNGWPDIRYCKFPEKVLVNGVLKYRDWDYYVDILRSFGPTGQTILSDIVFYTAPGAGKVVEVEYSSFDLGRYEWITVGRDSHPVDSAGSAMVSEYFDSKKEISVWMSGLDKQYSPKVPWIFSDLGTYGLYYDDPVEGRTHVRHAWCTTVPIESSNIITVGGPLANLGAYYLNDFTPAFWDYDNEQIIALSCWSMNAYRTGFDGAFLFDTSTGEWVPRVETEYDSDISYAVISTYKDKNQTAWFDIWGITGQDTYYATWAIWNTWLGLELQHEPNCLTTLIVRFNYSLHPYDPCFITVVESLGTISEYNWGPQVDMFVGNGVTATYQLYLSQLHRDNTNEHEPAHGIDLNTVLIIASWWPGQPMWLTLDESGKLVWYSTVSPYPITPPPTEGLFVVEFYLKKPLIHPCRPIPSL